MACALRFATDTMTAHPVTDLSLWEEVQDTVPKLVIADGPEVKIGVREGCLHITDGPRGARTRVFPAAKRLRGIRHVMILGGHGYVALPAYRWMADNDVTWSIIDKTGRVIRDEHMPRTLGTSGHYVDSALERKQAYCYAGGPMEAQGVQIIRRFMTSKLTGQARVAEHILGSELAAKHILNCLATIELCDTVADMLKHEANAAAMYFSVWKDVVTLKWTYPKPLSSKTQWHAYPGRASLAYDDEKNRNATDPVNALLNWGYRIAETEATLALLGACLSPTMGISHLDLASGRKRDAFALDLMEGLRPAVDEIVLDIISRPLDRRLFGETPKGVALVNAPLTHEVAARVHQAAYKLVPDVMATLRILTGKSS